MKRRILASALAVGMALSLVPAAFAEEVPVTGDQAVAQATAETALAEEPAAPAEEPAAEPEAVAEAAAPEAVAEEPAAEQDAEPVEEPEVAPAVTGMTVTHNGEAVPVQTVNGSFVVNAANGTNATDYTVTVTLSEGAEFAAPGSSTTIEPGDMYVISATEDSATLRIAKDEEDRIPIGDDQLDLMLTSAGDNTWTGSFANAEDISVDVLGSVLSEYDLQLVAGSLGEGSQAQQILVNHDAANTMVILCAPDAAVSTVTYVTDDGTFTGKYVNGMTVAMPSVALDEGESIAWFQDAEYATGAVTDITVNSDMTLYGQITEPETPDPDPNPDPDPEQPAPDFQSAYDDHQTATIDSLEDWEYFVSHSNTAEAGQLVILGADIDCSNATYPAMTFAGNFDGGNYTISNVKFNAGTASSGESSNGMFVKIGAGQIVANLNLSNVTVSGLTTTYAGALAGMVDGNNAVIQNVQVYGGSVSGRSAGGVVGFLRNAVVRYSSSRDTTVSGLANGGGVVGLNNGTVEYCFSTSTPTALPTLIGGSAGGVIGKNVRGGHGDYCWAYMKVLGDYKDGGGTVAHEAVINSSMDFETFLETVFDQLCWTASNSLPADFDSTVVTYNFNMVG